MKALKAIDFFIQEYRGQQETAEEEDTEREGVCLLAADACWYCTRVQGSANVPRLCIIPCKKNIRLKGNEELRKK